MHLFFNGTRIRRIFNVFFAFICVDPSNPSHPCSIDSLLRKRSFFKPDSSGFHAGQIGQPFDGWLGGGCISSPFSTGLFIWLEPFLDHWWLKPGLEER
jgi:hypothetical protein